MLNRETWCEKQLSGQPRFSFTRSLGRDAAASGLYLIPAEEITVQ